MARHPKIVVPREHGPHEFKSIEDVNNYLLRHKEVRARLKERGPGLLMLVMFDEETEFLAGELGLKIALPPAKLRKHIDSKITTTQLGNEAGIQSAPNTMGKAKTYEELCELADKANLGRDLVVQTPYGDSGRTTFFIKSEADWYTHEDDMVKEAAQSHAPHQPSAGHRRGGCDAPRNPGRADADRHHRLSRSHPLQGRLVRQ